LPHDHYGSRADRGHRRRYLWGHFPWYLHITRAGGDEHQGRRRQKHVYYCSPSHHRLLLMRYTSGRVFAPAAAPLSSATAPGWYFWLSPTTARGEKVRPSLHAPPRQATLSPVPTAPYPFVTALRPLSWYPGGHALRGLFPSPVDPDPFVIPPGPVARDPGLARGRRGGTDILTWRRRWLPHDYLGIRGRSRRSLLDNHFFAGCCGSTLSHNIAQWWGCRRYGVGRDDQKSRRRDERQCYYYSPHSMLSFPGRGWLFCEPPTH